MRIFKKDPSVGLKQPSWRDYQARYGRLRSRSQRRRPWLFPAMGTALLIIAGLLYALFSSSVAAPDPPSEPVMVDAKASPQETADLMSKKDVQVLLSQTPVDRLITEQTPVAFKGHRLLVETSLDMELQSYLIEKMDRKNSRYIGIVVMEADSGRILALAGFDKIDPAVNPCVDNAFPAASIFKMVTAAAAVDLLGYGPDTSLKFNGYKHTPVQKANSRSKPTAYTSTISLKNAFAQSVNPVSSEKSGTLKLGKDRPDANLPTPSVSTNPSTLNCPLSPATFRVSDDPYNWAEIASGFNNDTTISPLHGCHDGLGGSQRRPHDRSHHG